MSVQDGNNEVPPVAGQHTFVEFAAAMKALQTPPPEKGSVEKHITTIIVAASLGIGAWVLTSLNGVQQTLSRVDATMTTVQQTVNDTSRRVDALTSSQAQLQAEYSVIESRLQAVEKRRQ